MSNETLCASSPIDRQLVLERAQVIADDLRRFAERDKPSERARRDCDRRWAPDLAVVGVVPIDEFVAAARSNADDRFDDSAWAVLQFAVAFELVGTGNSASGEPWATVAHAFDDPDDPDSLNPFRVAHEPCESMVEVFEDWSLYGPDYDSCDHIAQFMVDIMDLAAEAYTVGVLDKVTAVLREARLQPAPKPKKFARSALP